MYRADTHCGGLTRSKLRAVLRRTRRERHGGPMLCFRAGRKFLFDPFKRTQSDPPDFCCQKGNSSVCLSPPRRHPWRNDRWCGRRARWTGLTIRRVARR